MGSSVSWGVCVAVALAAGCGRLGFDPVLGDDGVDGPIPVITKFTVSNGHAGSSFDTRTYQLGDPVVITWTVVATQRLGTGPIDLYVTTDGSTWTPVLQQYGGLSGHPSQYTLTYTGYVAPSSGFFRLKLVATDLPGQTSVPALSDVQNVTQWSVYAGSSDRGVGGKGRSLNLKGGNEQQPFAIDPIRGDLYAVDEGVGIVRMDAVTGLTSAFMQRTATGNNFVDDGPLPDPILSDVDLAPVFDHAGRLYVMTQVDRPVRSLVYQIDPATKRMRLYVGAAQVAMTSGVTFDENNSLYFLVSCTPDTWTASSATKLVKLAQNADGSPGAVTVVAGNCVRAQPNAAGDALLSPLSDNDYPEVSTIAAWNDGAVVVFAPSTQEVGPDAVIKILGGQLASSTIVCKTGSLSYDAGSGQLYCSDDAITAYVPNLTGPDGDVPHVFIQAAGTAGCNADGADLGTACVDAFKLVAIDRAGRIVFVDGAESNYIRSYRIRTIDGAGKVQTLMGTLPFVGDGLDASLTRGTFAGIYYKSGLEPAQQAFPAGLYFLERGGPVLGYVDPASHVVSQLWGNQIFDGSLATGAIVGPDVSLGLSRFSNAFPLTFDGDGLPWLRYTDALSKVDAGHAYVELQTGTGNWGLAANGDDPAMFNCHIYGLFQGLALSGQGAFFIGGYEATSSIRFLDFGAHAVTKIMGGAGGGASADTAVPGAVANLNLDAFCTSAASCHVRYQPNEDRLYFGELDKIRYITKPTSPGQSTLSTVFTASLYVGDFILSLDGMQLFYLTEDGRLYCHDLGSNAAWCNDTALGPPSGMMSAVNVPNQLTWIDASNLLINTGRGEIDQYRLP